MHACMQWSLAFLPRASQRRVLTPASILLIVPGHVRPAVCAAGNLIRTPDGRIAILDYGLMTQIDDVQRVALVRFIAHMCTEDWEGAALDLQVLGE